MYDCEAPEEYIKKLRVERDNETSYVKQTLLNDRINALSLGQRDTIIRVKAGTQLELKMINDKIDDCVAIVKSAFDHGVVPNMLWYGCERISQINVREHRKTDYDSISELTMKVCTAIEESIEELCGDIWHSKYNDPDDKNQETKFKILRKKFYTSESPEYSFDIITDGLVDMVELPTSAQYDLEVLVATLSIVKYLLTSRALIFDAFLLQHIFAYKLNWLPPVRADFNGSWVSPAMFKSMILPVISMSFGSIAGYARYTRAELTEVLTSEFMLLARAKGLTRTQATVRHALRNAMVPIFPMIIGEFISIMSGSLIIEQIFAIPGIGKIYLESINLRDYNVFLFLSMFYVAIGLVAGLLVDLSYGFVDPRIRIGGGKR